MRAEIIAVGSELLSFSRAETNSLFIASRLAPLGITVVRKFVVGDREKELRESLETALNNSEIVLISGGLGPTNDDITREVVASYMGLHLIEDPAILEQLEMRYSRFGLRLTPNNRKQAAVPEGADVLPNPHGTAPGLMIVRGESLVFLLPGPPRELYPMMDEQVIPRIQERKKTSPRLMRQLKVASEAESRVDAAIESIYRQYPDIETTILSSPGIISLYFLWNGEPEPRAEELLDELQDRIAERMGEAVFTRREESLVEVLGEQLRQNQRTLAVAESCTGGMVGKMLTDVAGSSDYFLGGVIAYSNATKSAVLGVSCDLLERLGAVSEEVAGQMASGVRRLLRADYGLSITGIAGPGGGTEAKPVGTIFMGLALEGEIEVRRLSLPGGREAIRQRTANMALDWLRRRLQ